MTSSTEKCKYSAWFIRMEQTMIENKEKITLGEFKAWLAGLILGKKGILPDLEDWKQIKIMLDKVEEEKEVVTIPSPAPYPAPTYPWDTRGPVYGPGTTRWSDNTSVVNVDWKKLEAMFNDWEKN